MYERTIGMIDDCSHSGWTDLHSFDGEPDSGRFFVSLYKKDVSMRLPVSYHYRSNNCTADCCC